ncbi:MAG: prepilin-type N-terminal cleavage/methylation domain-containing protein, partial [Nitrospinaceae bacterium]|nr:prepilin-type N-terminal cleavage/methylation domain-containing protein [Nitrospinaceae bacterium]NIR56093.1 prepilin-type N-terminal cleavage/methylation domain-containing protein [Nitrospinaceae bacterium]NIS86541.1 prepilin-type N-terminal cleavage/methylation domain-containing protein [Nitrospinaceae bacterium]NIT83375.1 prepilin-type N-terminal cleavage/methylation domain-containing protein [Nitrospinaceae bacterium]NIU45585.1 prepilin-type N-terminal cleavage/methylation domain-contain
QGFSLLEVIVALAIMAAGFLILMKLFSGSIRSVDLSDQYMKAVMLGNSKLAELELVDFRTNEDSGTFESHDRFQWELDVRPYESPLNDGG